MLVIHSSVVAVLLFNGILPLNNRNINVEKAREQRRERYRQRLEIRP